MFEDILPVLFFIGYIIYHLIKDADKEETGKENKNPMPSKPQPQRKTTNTNNELNVKKRIDKKTKEQEKVQKKILEAKRIKEKIKKAKRQSSSNKRKQDKDSINLDLNNEQELLKAIVYKEILDKPRAKKTYLPPYLR